MSLRLREDYSQMVKIQDGQLWTKTIVSEKKCNDTV
jgi:hypothetical protein